MSGEEGKNGGPITAGVGLGPWHVRLGQVRGYTAGFGVLDV